MFVPQKNSYLQLVCAINPRVINKAVDRAMQQDVIDLNCVCHGISTPHKKGDPCPCANSEGDFPERLVSMQPSLFAPHVDITRARLGFGRIGLRVLNRDLHSPDHLTQIQALHTLMDQVQISESALFLINLQVVYRLLDLMLNEDPIIREKVCIIYNHLANIYQGRKRIMSRIKIIDNLIWLIMRDRKEIRFAAANTLKTLARDRCACEFILKSENIVENLLEMIKHDHTGIVLLHLQTFANLTEMSQTKPLLANAFQVMRTLFDDPDPRIIARSMDCMAQLCKHEVGRTLADENDITFFLYRFLFHENIEVVIAAVGLMCYTTLTTRSKWRAKEKISKLSRRLIMLCHIHNKPMLQLWCIQVLINLADMPACRKHLKKHWERRIMNIKIRTHEDWDGSTETTSFGLETGHNYRTMCIEGIETIKNDYGDNPNVLNVHSYVRRLNEKKQQLLNALNWKPYLDRNNF